METFVNNSDSGSCAVSCVLFQCP